MMSLADVRALPKIELHRHLEGAMRTETLWEICASNDPSRYASIEALRAACTVEKNSAPGFGPFLEKFNALRFCFGGEANVERVAAEAVEDAANDGVTYLELRFSPVSFARRLIQGDGANALVSVEQAEAAAEAVISGARAAASRCAIRVEFIATCARHFGLKTNKPTLDLLHRPVGMAFCGLDLAGDEAHSANAFLPAFREWKAAGKQITIHAGEDPNGPGAANVAEAFERLCAYRVGHGVRAIEDPLVVKRLALSGVTLELCPTSNIQTRAVPSAAQHPIKKLLDARIKVTINTDDPAVCGTTLSDEYILAAEQMGLSFDDLKCCTVNAARAAFLPEEERNALRAQVEKAWDDYADDYISTV